MIRAMEERTLELTIISAQSLKKVSSFGHDTNYAVAYIYSSEKKASKVDRDGGVNPTWDDTMTLTCDDKLLQRGGSYITVEIYSYGTFSNKLVGTSKISLVDVGKQVSGESQRIAVEVRRPSGKVKGVLNVAVKVGETRTVDQNNRSGQAFAQYPPQYGGAPAEYPAIYPPQNWNTTSYPPTYSSGYGLYADNGVSVYPPSKPSRNSIPASTDVSNSRRQEEPVIAYPATGVPGTYQPQQYGYGPQYNVPQYYSGPVQVPYGYQQDAGYGQQSRWHGSSSSGGGGAGLGLLGGVLGGFLLGDVIGNIF